MALRLFFSLFTMLYATQGFSGFEIGQYYNLVSRYSGKCLDLKDHGTSDGTRLQQWDCTGENQQIFRLEGSSPSTVKLVGYDSDRCVEVVDYSQENGAEVRQWECNTDTDQDLVFLPQDDGSYKFSFAHSGKCLDVGGPSRDNGALVHQWECVEQDNQVWELSKVSGIFKPILDLKPGALYQIISRNSNKCLDVKDHGTANGVELQQWDCTGESQQLFRLMKNEDSTYSLRGKDSDRCVEVADGGRNNGDKVRQWDCVNGPNQRLNFFHSLDGAFTARFQHSGKCLDVSGPSTENGALVHQWDCVGQANQDWRLVEIADSPNPNAGIRVLIDNSDETTADIKIIGVDDSVKPTSVIWHIYRDGQSISALDNTTTSVDLTRLGNFAGLKLGAVAVVNGQLLESENQIELYEVVTGPLHSETLVAQKEGLGLLGTPVVRRLKFTYETFQVGCKKKTVVSWNGIWTEENCDYRTRIKDFTPEELAILRAAAVTAFKTLMKQDNNLGFIVSKCAIKKASPDQGKFSMAKGVALEYSNENAAKILENQLLKWDIFGQIEDFNIHFRVNYSWKPANVIAHANLGEVKENFEHVKSRNTNRNRFEVHVGRRWLPPAIDKEGSVSWTDKNGKEYISTTSLKETAGTIAHEMMHQMGISHTQDEEGEDMQDDFVYNVGNCTSSNWVSDIQWNDTVGF